MPQDDVLIRLFDPGDAEQLSALTAIYEEAIPASERKSEAQIAAMTRDPRYRFLAACAAGRLVGFAIVYLFRGESLSLLEYMAVDRARRSRGIGGQLFRAALGVGDPDKPMLLEVDSEREPSDDQAQREKRKRFYRRLGCREIAGLTYILPMGDRPPRMNLLVHDPRRDRIDCATAAQWLTLLYGEVYGCPASDPRIAAMVAGLPETLELI